MIETNETFEERKQEIEFYYSVLIDMDAGKKDIINTINNKLFFRIMKSNFILMLYNIVEATVTTGMLEIYEQVRNDGCTYYALTRELQDIWRDYKVKEIYRSSSELKAYIHRVEDIVNDIINETPIIFDKHMLDINGNLNAERIKDICDKHSIRYRAKDEYMRLDKVKEFRNSLAHGDESFSNCTRDLTISDLGDIKNTIFDFLSGIIAGMKKYYDEKQYLKAT